MKSTFFVSHFSRAASDRAYTQSKFLGNFLMRFALRQTLHYLPAESDIFKFVRSEKVFDKITHETLLLPYPLKHSDYFFFVFFGIIFHTRLLRFFGEPCPFSPRQLLWLFLPLLLIFEALRGYLFRVFFSSSPSVSLI